MALSREHMQALTRRICSLSSIPEIAGLLQTGLLDLMRLRFEKPYFIFQVRKQKGKERLIESPKKELKVVLRKLSEFLQSTYFFYRSPAAYGFIQQPRHSPKKYNILTNAKLHCGKKYLINIDLRDFFHQISRTRVISIFRSDPFDFDIELSNFLGELTTYRDRLPIGSPTSPVLSNFAARDLDSDLLSYSRTQSITYSRYVDDLSFSSQKQFTVEQYYTLQDIIGKKGFSINMQKVKWMHENDDKCVTGLRVTTRPEIPDAFICDLESNLTRLKHVLEFSAVAKSNTPDEWIEQFDEHLKGKLRFVQMVYGWDHPISQKLGDLYQHAKNTSSFVQSFSWNNFPYA